MGAAGLRFRIFAPGFGFPVPFPVEHSATAELMKQPHTFSERSTCEALPKYRHLFIFLASKVSALVQVVVSCQCVSPF